MCFQKSSGADLAARAHAAKKTASPRTAKIKAFSGANPVTDLIYSLCGNLATFNEHRGPDANIFLLFPALHTKVSLPRKMSYLDSLRFNFAGQFQAAPSTVNNDPLHFDNRTFQPSYQLPSSGNQPNGWWNPTGDAVWRLIGCNITAAWTNHAPVPASDPIHGYLVADSDRTVSGKLVDLDPEQQTVSEIWGMQVRICTDDGTNLMRSSYKTAPFTDIWDRAPGGGDLIAGAAYQSVLDDIEWGDLSKSPFLQALRAAAASGKLSIKFNVDGYDMTPTSPTFTRGRIVGTIGPYAEGEPNHFVIGRHFVTADLHTGNFFVPSGGINFCPATVDKDAGKIYLDLGNALPTQTSGGPITDIGALTLGYSGASAPIDAIDYRAQGWYESTAGVVELPAARKLTADELQAIASNPLVLTLSDSSGKATGGASEPPDGLYARADQFVFRASPGDTAEVHVFATRFGEPYAGARVVSIFDPSQLQPQSNLGPAPSVATPESAVEFPARVVADEHGLARLPIRVTNPGNPRTFIDGQVYGIRPILEDTLAYGTGDTYNPWDFVSLLLFGEFHADEPPTWYGSLEPIFQQYANLYPVMKKFLDMADYDSVCANARLLQLAFGLPMEDPNSMPITRDLSPAKRATILRWLREPGPDGKPRKGTQPPPSPPPPVAAAPAPAAEAAEQINPMRGGKAIAMSRRLMFRRRR
jgi:hypothetical protein